jgi:hypothetical protein
MGEKTLKILTDFCVSQKGFLDQLHNNQFIKKDPKLASCPGAFISRDSPVDLYSKPVAVAAASVLSSSSLPLPHDNKTPNPLYITASTPRVLAVADPCFITEFMSLLRENRC